MNKLTIPAILVATVMVAGIFAFMPVEQASTVHLSGTITGVASQIILVSGVITPAAGGDATDAIACVKTSTNPFHVLAVNLATTLDANTNLDLAVFVDGELSTDLSDDPGSDITAVTAVGTADDNFDYLAVNTLVGNPNLAGTTTVTFGPLADATAGDAVDEVTVSFIIAASGADVASDFVCTQG